MHYFYPFLAGVCYKWEFNVQMHPTAARIGIGTYIIKLQNVLTLIWYDDIFMLYIRFIIILTYFLTFYYFYHGDICIYGLLCASYWHKMWYRVVLLLNFTIMHALPILLLAQPSFTYYIQIGRHQYSIFVLSDSAYTYIKVTSWSDSLI